ncbi:MAG: two component transcriptional regulator, winged helix family [Moraxellaceae bacterium]|jgi:two-component system phosphate regulon response regulator PhoB|nr:two component transcriptional regulator, winged helix family [Moraxellaceae bacterium]
MSAVILLIHEDLLAQRFIRHVLEVQGGYVVVAASDSDAALQALHRHDLALAPDVVVTGGRQHAQVMASPLHRHPLDNRRLPVLVLDEDERVAITPSAHRVAAEARELLLKLKGVLRPTQAQERVLEHAGLRLDPVQQQAYAGELPLNLTALGFRLLHFLMAHPGRVYTRALLLETVWAGQSFVEERTVDVHVYRLRNQLARFGHGQLIEAVRGSGYRFALAPPRPAAIRHVVPAAL